MMDVECVDRFCDWFSHHLSNFEFKWHWQKWCAGQNQTKMNQPVVSHYKGVYTGHLCSR